MHIANLLLPVGMKPFPLNSCSRNYEQLSWNKLTQTKEGFFTSIQISWGNLNKVPAITSIKQKVSSSLEDIASNSKVYIDKKAKYVIQMLQLSTGDDQHDWNLFSCISSNLILLMLHTKRYQNFSSF